jgi:proline-specific peptidase
VKSQEGYIEVDGGRVWYRSVGEGGTPLLCLHGGPGFTHHYLEPLEALEALADRRQVIFYDQLGCGRADRPQDPGLWTVPRFVEEVAQVRAALGLTRLHPPARSTRRPSSASTGSTSAGCARGRPAWSGPSPRRATPSTTP